MRHSSLDLTTKLYRSSIRLRSEVQMPATLAESETLGDELSPEEMESPEETSGDELSPEEIELLEQVQDDVLAASEYKAAAAAASLFRNPIPRTQDGSLASLLSHEFERNGVPRIESVKMKAPWLRYQRPELRRLELAGRSRGLAVQQVHSIGKEQLPARLP